MARFFKGAVSLKEVRAELASKFKKVVDSGLRITHIDSHSIFMSCLELSTSP